MTGLRAIYQLRVGPVLRGTSHRRPGVLTNSKAGSPNKPTLAAAPAEKLYEESSSTSSIEAGEAVDAVDAVNAASEASEASSEAAADLPPELHDAQAHYFSIDGEEYVCGKLSCTKVEEPKETSWLDVIPSRVRGLIMLNLLVLLCGTNWVVVKEAGAWDPFYFCSLRFIVAALFFAPVLVRAAKNVDVVKGGVEIGIYTAVGYLLQAEGLLTTDASRASFLSTFTVLVVPFLAGLSGRGVKPITWFSATAALVGVSLLEQSGSSPSLGDLWSALSAVCFGVQMFRTEAWARVLGKDSSFELMGVVLATTAVITTGAALGTHPALLTALGSFEVDQLAGIPWGEVLYTGLLTTDVVLLMEVFALQDISSVEASVIYTLEPVVGACFAFALLGERISPLGIFGAAIILTSCLATQLLGAESEDEAGAGVGAGIGAGVGAVEAVEAVKAKAD